MGTKVKYDWRKSVRTTDPETSVDAAKAAGGSAERQHELILSALADSAPLAAEQIADLIGVPIWRRMSELERAGLIIKTTELHTNRSGRSASKYIAA
jgi:predicted ArsR family transcriptional regulator